MSAGQFQVDYSELALRNLRGLPKAVAAQIVRKISRLEKGLHGVIKRLQKADFGYKGLVIGRDIHE